ncbi:ferredoxin [Thomasclavelia cocleata]|uniref:ferredoxin n=1 Tax=Thomasclavelia cocleata TaxID=69824 RepID=UPI0020123BA0|nr:ferredoxin [Thomasclavelia cocleata]
MIVHKRRKLQWLKLQLMNLALDVVLVQLFAPDVFEIGDDGLAVVVSEENIDGAKEAAESCPVEAIEVE